MKHQCETCNDMTTTTSRCEHCSKRTCKKCLRRCHGMIRFRYRDGTVDYVCAPPGQQDLFSNVWTRPIDDNTTLKKET